MVTIISATGLVYFADDQTLGVLSPVLNSLEFIAANATGVELTELSKENSIQIFPNPVVDQVRINFNPQPTTGHSSPVTSHFP